MIEDGATIEQKAEVMLTKYEELPRDKYKKRIWLKGVTGESKQAMKMVAKEKEKAQMEKMQKWLHPEPKAKPQRKDLRLPIKAKPEADAKTVPDQAPEPEAAAVTEKQEP